MPIALTIVAALALGATALVVQLRHRYAVVVVDGESMLPTLRPEDRVLVRRTRPHLVRTGQVVVLGSPRPRRARRDDLTIKRVVALPGEPVPAPLATTWPDAVGSPVPPGRIVVLGDNLAASLDSRQCGPLGLDRVRAVVVRTMSARPATRAVPGEI